MDTQTDTIETEIFKALKGGPLAISALEEALGHLDIKTSTLRSRLKALRDSGKVVMEGTRRTAKYCISH